MYSQGKGDQGNLVVFFLFGTPFGTAGGQGEAVSWEGVMAQEYAKEFYNSPAWKNCRNAYAKSKGHLCERCMAKGIFKQGEIVHHRKHLTPENISDPNVALDWKNLELLCRDCHALAHKPEKRYKINNFGQVIVIE